MKYREFQHFQKFAFRKLEVRSLTWSNSRIVGQVKAEKQKPKVVVVVVIVVFLNYYLYGVNCFYHILVACEGTCILTDALIFDLLIFNTCCAVMVTGHDLQKATVLCHQICLHIDINLVHA